MLYTLTTNPAIDMNITTNGIKPSVVNRTFDTVYTANGKGVNVSYVLNHFGVNSTILGFFGGFSGDYIVSESKKKGLCVLPVWVEDTTRINIFLNDGKEEYKFVNGGSFVTKPSQRELLRILQDAQDLDYLVISGSLPPGIEFSFYEEILEICAHQKTKVILDISAPVLKNLLRFKPLLIKPNDEEIEDIFGIKMQDEADITDTLHMLYELGAQNILLTLGQKGSYFYDGKQIYHADTQPVKLLSSACAGDAALAGFLSVWLDDPTNIEDALKRSAAAGANVAESNALGDLKKVHQYFNHIHIRKVEQ